jgi:hypothetical protein
LVQSVNGNFAALNIDLNEKKSLLASELNAVKSRLRLPKIPSTSSPDCRARSLPDAGTPSHSALP